MPNYLQLNSENAHIEWAIQILNNSGYLLHENTLPEIILRTPWSQVCRFQTKLGWAFLKKVPPALSLEAHVIELLEKKFHAPVPHVLANNQELHCFLMRDAGIPLHEVFKQEFKPNLLIDMLHHYSLLQINSADNLNLLLDLGVPDWRLEKLPKLYRQLISEEELLLGDGLTLKEIKQLKNLAGKLEILCEQLGKYAIPDTFGHADFHDENILVNPSTNQTTLIDLGEVVITHPFFSLVNCVFRATEHLKLVDIQYRQLQEACFKNWLDLESLEHLFEIIDLINRCWTIHAVLGEYRLIQSIAPESLKTLSRQGRFRIKLKIWLEQASSL